LDGKADPFFVRDISTRPLPRLGLSVSDDGVGRATTDGGHLAAGLGTSIVEALAHQLDARLEISSGPQGTIVSVVHSPGGLREVEHNQELAVGDAVGNAEALFQSVVHRAQDKVQVDGA
jgi:hypothetical protein